ncbi:MAG: hypothetical protein HFF56_09310 [Lawsonibacter sp.]|nr:hypothetical protein [Lawsonibacter sp.]
MGISLKFYPEYITFPRRWQLKPLERQGSGEKNACKNGIIHLVFSCLDIENAAQDMVDKRKLVCYNRDRASKMKRPAAAGAQFF